MYCTKNFKSKKELKAAVQAWNDYQANGKVTAYVAYDASPDNWRKPQPVTYFQPGPFGGNEPRDGTIYVEGPHYPAPHRFYARCTAENGVIVKVK